MSNEALSASYLDLLVRHEQAMACLYRMFESRLKGAESEFWGQIAYHEEWHAAILRGLTRDVADAQLDLRQDAMPRLKIAQSLERVRSVIASFDGKDPSDAQALDAALSLEKDAVESDAFSVFAGDAPNAKEAFHLIAAQTTAHMCLLEDRRAAARDGVEEGNWLSRLHSIFGSGKKA